jgi:hypothetical protein
MAVTLRETLLVIGICEWLEDSSATLLDFPLACLPIKFEFDVGSGIIGALGTLFYDFFFLLQQSLEVLIL